jgi:hypothetical protein
VALIICKSNKDKDKTDHEIQKTIKEGKEDLWMTHKVRMIIQGCPDSSRLKVTRSTSILLSLCKTKTRLKVR